MPCSLSSQRDFLLLWGGQFVSDLGGRLSLVALPCALVLSLHAAAWSVGVLQAIETAVVPLFAMIVGVYVDRLACRPVMLAANGVRGLALASLPVAAALHRLTVGHLVAAAAIVALASLVFETAYGALVPRMLAPRERAAGNAKLTAAASAAELIGTSMGGAIVQALGAPFAFLLNACSFAVASAALARMRHDERADAPTERRSFRADFREGLRAIVGDRILRTIAFGSALAHLGGAAANAVVIVYLLRTSHLTPLALGLALGVANVGVAGALVATRCGARFGRRAVLVGATLVAACGTLVLPLFGAHAPLASVVAMRLCLTFAGPIFEVTAQSVRIERVPEALQGRAAATMRTIVWGALPVGSLAGAFLGERVGCETTMLVGAGVIAAAAAVLAPRPTQRETSGPSRPRIARQAFVAVAPRTSS